MNAHTPINGPKSPAITSIRTPGNACSLRTTFSTRSSHQPLALIPPVSGANVFQNASNERLLSGSGVVRKEVLADTYGLGWEDVAPLLSVDSINGAGSPVYEGSLLRTDAGGLTNGSLRNGESKAIKFSSVCPFYK